MSSTTYWILFFAPVVPLVLWRMAAQRQKGVLFVKRLVFRIAASVLIFELYVSLVERFWHPSMTDASLSSERLVRGGLFWLLDFWCLGFFDRSS